MGATDWNEVDHPARPDETNAWVDTDSVVTFDHQDPEETPTDQLLHYYWAKPPSDRDRDRKNADAAAAAVSIDRRLGRNHWHLEHDDNDEPRFDLTVWKKSLTALEWACPG